MTDKPTIEERENGPLVVKGLTRLIGPDGTEMEVKPVMALCRCGHSKNKPFCDGSHITAGFQSRGGAPAGIDRVLVYKGADVSISFNPRLCGMPPNVPGSRREYSIRLANHGCNPKMAAWMRFERLSQPVLRERWPS